MCSVKRSARLLLALQLNLWGFLVFGLCGAKCVNKLKYFSCLSSLVHLICKRPHLDRLGLAMESCCQLCKFPTS